MGFSACDKAPRIASKAIPLTPKIIAKICTLVCHELRGVLVVSSMKRIVMGSVAAGTFMLGGSSIEHVK